VNIEPTLWKRARWQFARGWMLWLVVLVCLGAATARIALYKGPQASSGDDVQATISGFAPEDTILFRRGIVVTATFEGAYGQRAVPLETLAGCKVGDPIRAVRQGLHLRLYPMPCRD